MMAEADKTLTQIESDVFDFIASNQETLSPTYKEIAEGVGLGRAGNAFVVVQRLVEKGFVKTGSGGTYNPQKTKGHVNKKSVRRVHLQAGETYGATKKDNVYESTERYPRSVLVFSSDTQSSSLHPTQKPVALMEYLIRTYTNEGETVLDFTMGSGTTGIACQNTGRKFIGIEKDDAYFQIAIDRNQKWMDEAATRDSQGDLF